MKRKLIYILRMSQNVENPVDRSNLFKYLMDAIRVGHIKVVQDCISAGKINLQAVDEYDYSPLILVCLAIWSRRYGILDSMRSLEGRFLVQEESQSETESNVQHKDLIMSRPVFVGNTRLWNCYLNLVRNASGTRSKGKGRLLAFLTLSNILVTYSSGHMVTDILGSFVLGSIQRSKRPYQKPTLEI
jgi:hypothetical protein